MEENRVEQAVEQPAEDALLEEIVEEPEDSSVSLEDALGDGQPGEEAEPEEPQGTGGRKEPGYVQQRISKAVSKAVAETEARLKAEFETQLAPYREQMVTMEAQRLVQEGKVKDLETAKELVRYRQNQPQPVKEQTPDRARNSQGQYAKTEDPATSARIDMLQHQADRIKASGGPDVIAEFKNNEDIRKAVISGEMDFYDVAEQLRTSKRKPSSPVRSPNGASSNAARIDFATMSSEQFARLEKKIDEGARISLR